MSCSLMTEDTLAEMSMSLSSANRIRLENLADDGKAGAALAVKVLDRFDDALSAILIVTSCILPCLGLVVILWLTKLLFGVDVVSRARSARPGMNPGERPPERPDPSARRRA